MLYLDMQVFKISFTKFVFSSRYTPGTQENLPYYRGDLGPLNSDPFIGGSTIVIPSAYNVHPPTWDRASTDDHWWLPFI